MNCPICQERFSEEPDNTPIILINCGHSICNKCFRTHSEQCLNQDEYENKINIKCPDCGKCSLADTIDSFPQNIALLNMVTSGHSFK